MVSTKERLSQERRRRRLRLLKITFLFFCFIGFLTGAYQIIHQPWFSFGQVEVSGNSNISKEEVIKNASLKDPINLFLINRSQIEQDLRQDYRIEEVGTAYLWPNILQIIIKERKPSFYIKTAYNGFVQIDFDGYVLKVGKGIKDAVVPYVSGIDAGNVYLGDKVEQEDVLYLLDFLQRLDKNLLVEIAGIAVDGQNKVTVQMTSDVKIIVGELKDIGTKADSFVTICNEIKTKNIEAEYIDLTFSKPYIKVKR